jgi:hypothetical protein
MSLSVQPRWMLDLPLQQQSVLLLACRGPDGVRKFHPCKPVVLAYRATCFLAAYFGRPLAFGEGADTFMSLDRFAADNLWRADVKSYFDTVDEIPHHYHLHLIHGAEILGYKHPDERFRSRWNAFYIRACDDAHMNVETEEEMDSRLSDWGRMNWDDAA